MSTVEGRIPVAEPNLRAFTIASMMRVGVTADDAAKVADVLLAADLRGVDSHGVARLRRYVAGIQKGMIHPDFRLTTILEGPVTAALDAGNGLGQPASIAAMQLAIDKARQFGMGMVTLRRSNHFGIAGYYAMLALAHDMIGIVTTNASPQVAPTFAAEPMYGTNPLAIAMPTGGPCPFVLDMATSTVPRGKLETLHRQGKPIPAGWAVDEFGNVMTEVGDLISGLMERRGYALLPLGGAGETFGGHKGYGLALMTELLCGPLAGAAWGKHVYGPEGANLGQCFMAIRIDCFRTPEEYRQETAQLLAEMRGAKKAVNQDRIYIHGEKEAEEQGRRLASGIPLLAKVYQDLQQLAEEIDVPFALE